MCANKPSQNEQMNNIFQAEIIELEISILKYAYKEKNFERIIIIIRDIR